MTSNAKIIEERIGSAPARTELSPNPVLCIFERDGAEESTASAVQKSVNDRIGRPADNRVIRGLASLLTDRLRTTGIIGRHGGEEFGALLLNTPAEAATNVIDALRRTMCEAALDIGGQSLSVTFSAALRQLPAARPTPTGSQLLSRISMTPSVRAAIRWSSKTHVSPLP
jgi:Diguanylate cyclase, GGDEF domain